MDLLCGDSNIKNKLKKLLPSGQCLLLLFPMRKTNYIDRVQEIENEIETLEKQIPMLFPEDPRRIKMENTIKRLNERMDNIGDNDYLAYADQVATDLHGGWCD